MPATVGIMRPRFGSSRSGVFSALIPCIDDAPRSMVYDENDDPDSAPLDDDEDNLMRHRRPLDLALALDGRRRDEVATDEDGQDADETADAWDGQESAQDAAEQGDGLDDDADGTDAPGAAQGEKDRVWLVSMAERDEDGEWRLVGEPVPDARFDCMGTAHLYAENRNKREFGKGFDWLADPPRAWLVVAESGLGERVLRVNRPRMSD